MAGQETTRVGFVTAIEMKEMKQAWSEYVWLGMRQLGQALSQLFFVSCEEVTSYFIVKKNAMRLVLGSRLKPEARSQAHPRIMGTG